MSGSSDYVPPKVWTWNKANGGQFASINRPIAGATHEQRIDDPAEEAGDRADRRADQEGKNDADQRHLQVEARAPDNAREDIAAEIVGAEGMQQRRRLQPHIGILHVEEKQLCLATVSTFLSRHD